MFVIHSLSSSYTGIEKVNKKELKRMKDYILERTEIPKSALNKKRSNDWELCADECEKYKVCTAIITNLKDMI